jgi:SLT domain-containing protein
MLENLDKIKDRISSINGQFKSLKSFSDSKSSELFSKMLDFKQSQVENNKEIESVDAVIAASNHSKDNKSGVADSKLELTKLLSQGLNAPSLGLDQTPDNNSYLQALLLNSIKNIKN